MPFCVCLALLHLKNFKFACCLGGFHLQITLNLLKCALSCSYRMLTLPFKNMPPRVFVFKIDKTSSKTEMQQNMGNLKMKNLKLLNSYSPPLINVISHSPPITDTSPLQNIKKTFSLKSTKTFLGMGNQLFFCLFEYIECPFSRFGALYIPSLLQLFSIPFC